MGRTVRTTTPRPMPTWKTPPCSSSPPVSARPQLPRSTSGHARHSCTTGTRQRPRPAAWSGLTAGAPLQGCAQSWCRCTQPQAPQRPSGWRRATQALGLARRRRGPVPRAQSQRPHWGQWECLHPAETPTSGFLSRSARAWPWPGRLPCCPARSCALVHPGTSACWATSAQPLAALPAAGQPAAGSCGRLPHKAAHTGHVWAGGGRTLATGSGRLVPELPAVRRSPRRTRTS